MSFRGVFPGFLYINACLWLPHLSFLLPVYLCSFPPLTFSGHCSGGTKPDSLCKTSLAYLILKAKLFCSTQEREILLSVGMLSHYLGAGERNFSNCIISKWKDLWNLYNYLHNPVYFHPTAKMQVSSTECPQAGPWREAIYCDSWEFCLCGKSTWWEALSSCSLGSLLQIPRTCCSWWPGVTVGMVLGVPGERGRQEGFPWGWGMGAEAAQIHVSSSHVGVEGDISTQNTQILLHVWSSHWVETENQRERGLNEGRGLPE